MEKLQTSYLYYYWITLWGWAVNLGVAKVPEDQKLRVKASNRAVLTYWMHGHVYSVVYLAFGAWNLLALNLICGLLAPVNLLLNAKGYYRFGRIFQSVSFVIAIAFIDSAIGVQSGIELLFFPAIASVFINFNYEEKRDLNLALGLTALVAVGSRLLTSYYQPWVTIPNPWMPYVSAMVWLGSILIFVLQISTLFKSYERSKKEVIRSHAHTKAVMESVDDGFYVVDSDWTILYYNPTAASFLESFGVKDATGMNFWHLIPAENEQVYVPEIKEAMKTQSRYRREFFDTASQLWSEIIAYPTGDGMSVTFRGIQDRKLSEIALRDSEQLQRAIFEEAATGLNILSPEGVFLRVNGEMCRLLGYTEQELVGMTVAQLTFEGDLEKSRADVARLMRGDITTMSKQKLYRHKSGRAVPCNLQVRSVLDEVGMPKFMVSSVQDLSDAKFAEQKLIQASKMSSLGEMAGSIAHEINSPMAVIQLSAEQLEDPEMVEFFDKEDIAMIAKRITDTVERISKIIRGLKNFSRNAEHDAMETVSLASVIDDSLELCREKFKNRNIEIRMADLPEVDVLCRPTELCQVLLNLLSNAFDAIDERKDGERWVEISGTYRFSRILLNVTDSGPGIPKAVSDRMHEPFFTTKPLGKGTGLGLSISKGIVENHGGHITLDSACKNTRFVMDLPATISAPALASAPEVKLASGS